MKFRFHEEEDPCEAVTGLAAHMALVRPEHVLVADWLHEQWNPELVNSLMDCMRPGESSYRYQTNLGCACRASILHLFTVTTLSILIS